MIFHIRSADVAQQAAHRHVLHDEHGRLGLQAGAVELHDVAVKADAPQQLDLLHAKGCGRQLVFLHCKLTADADGELLHTHCYPSTAFRTFNACIPPQRWYRSLTRQGSCMPHELKLQAHPAEDGQLRSVYVYKELHGRVLHALAHRAVHLPLRHATIFYTFFATCKALLDGRHARQANMRSAMQKSMQHEVSAVYMHSS